MKRYKDKIGKRFSAYLLKHPVFQNDWKAVISAQIFLETVITTGIKNRSGKAFLHSDGIKNTFRISSTNGYRPYVEALRELKLLEIDESYKNATDGTDGFTKAYKATELAVDMVYDANREYLYKLFQDEELQRKTTKRKYKRKKLEYDKCGVEHISSFLRTLKIDDASVLTYLDEKEDGKSGKIWQQTLLKIIKEGKYRPLKPNESDGRYWNEFVSLDNYFKDKCTCGGRRMAAVIDIRACHPSYLGKYLEKITKPTPEFQREVAMWSDLWTNQDFDPRPHIGEMIGRTKAEVKEAVNKSINGHMGYSRFLNWFNEYFPLMYAAFQDTDKTETSNQISKQFETVIMLNENIYKVADMVDIRLAYEYDGFRLFSRSNPNKVAKEANYIVHQIKETSRNFFGVTPAVKVVIV